MIALTAALVILAGVLVLVVVIALSHAYHKNRNPACTHEEGDGADTTERALTRPAATRALGIPPRYGIHPIPPRYGTHPIPQRYGAHSMPQRYGAHSMPQTSYEPFIKGDWNVAPTRDVARSGVKYTLEGGGGRSIIHIHKEGKDNLYKFMQLEEGVSYRLVIGVTGLIFAVRNNSGATNKTWFQIENPHRYKFEYRQTLDNGETKVYASTEEGYGALHLTPETIFEWNDWGIEKGTIHVHVPDWVLNAPIYNGATIATYIPEKIYQTFAVQTFYLMRNDEYNEIILFDCADLYTATTYGYNLTIEYYSPGAFAFKADERQNKPTIDVLCVPKRVEIPPSYDPHYPPWLDRNFIHISTAMNSGYFIAGQSVYAFEPYTGNSGTLDPYAEPFPSTNGWMSPFRNTQNIPSFYSKSRDIFHIYMLIAN